MGSLLDLIYPHQCVMCDALVEQAGGLCGSCWRETPFITGVVCDICGTPLMGEDDGTVVHCDECMITRRPWVRGRSALLYRDAGRRSVLSLKHGDRLDIIGPGASWMHRAARDILLPDMVVVPVPAHWMRMMTRRYNQAALLAQRLGQLAGLSADTRALTRIRRTDIQDGKSRAERFSNIQDAIRPHPRHGARLNGRPVLIVDDVMTTGATLAATSEAALLAGAEIVHVVTLARVAADT